MAPEKKPYIRQMEIDDIPAVYWLGEKLFTSSEFPTLYRTWDAYEVTEHFSSDPTYCLVAELEDEIVGFVLATTVEKKGTAWNKYGFLTWIAIDEPYQRQHVGRRFYRELEKRWRKNGIRMMLVETDDDNIDAINFFTATGFSPTGKHVWLAKTLQRKYERKPK
ncbi:MAG: GNAT family N-acetyltransferase [Dehalococcoidia bacterium]